jgi:hypothetical protein
MHLISSDSSMSGREHCSIDGCPFCAVFQATTRLAGK